MTSVRARVAYAQILVCTLAWGSLGVVRRHVDLPSTVVVFFRLSLGAVVVLGWLVARRRLPELRPSRRPALLIGSGVALGIHWVLEFEAFARLDVATAILIVFIGPVLMAIAAPYVLNEKLHLVPIVALALAFGGIALIALPGISSIDPIGLASALASAVLFAVIMLLGKILTEHYTSPALVVWQLGVATVLLSPVLLGADWDGVAREIPLLAILGALYTGLLGIVFFQAVRALPAQRLGVLFYLEPASAVAYAWIFLAETPAALTLIGGALVVVAGLAIILSDRSVSVAPSALPDPPETAKEAVT